MDQQGEPGRVALPAWSMPLPGRRPCPLARRHGRCRSQSTPACPGGSAECRRGWGWPFSSSGMSRASSRPTSVSRAVSVCQGNSSSVQRFGRRWRHGEQQPGRQAVVEVFLVRLVHRLIDAAGLIPDRPAPPPGPWAVRRPQCRPMPVGRGWYACRLCDPQSADQRGASTSQWATSAPRQLL